MKCRACMQPLASVLDFGALRLSCFPREAIELPRAPKLPCAPLDLCRCVSCGLVQLSHTVPPSQLFQHYWYRSGVNETMRAELANVVADGITHVGGLSDGALVVDIGANDGTLLAEYAEQAPDVHMTRVAYEPAENLQPMLRAHCEILKSDYFPDGSHTLGHVQIVTSIACFYAVDDPIAFIRVIDRLLAPNGVWIVQFQDLCQMLQATAFDDICHEHLFYPSLASVERMLASFNLVVFDAERRDINGGSLRLVIGRRHRVVSERVAILRQLEAGCESLATLRDFAQRVSDTRRAIYDAVWSLHRKGVIIDLYGASTKGNMLLQICGLGPDMLRQAWERSEAKWGCQTVTGIPIVSEEVGRRHPPDVLFVGIWQFREAILRREVDFEGQFLFPLPAVEVVSRVVQ
jgi:NDP-4-keto-2,6-dideoxyhexose 3-C-methyltransferase